MGRLYDKPRGSGFMLWNTEKIEDLVLLISYFLVMRRIPKSDEWVQIFEDHFWAGHAVADKTCVCLNTYLRRVGLREIFFEETQPLDDYVRHSDFQNKRIERQRLRDDLEGKTEQELRKMLEAAWITVDELPYSHQRYQDYVTKPLKQDIAPKPINKVTLSKSIPTPKTEPVPELKVNQTPASAGTNPKSEDGVKLNDVIWLIEQTNDQNVKEELVKKAASILTGA